MGLSSPSGHKPQRSAVQLEHVLELLISEHIGLAEAVAAGTWPSRRTDTPVHHPRLYAAARWELAGHRYVYIEERTEGAGWLVLQSPPQSICGESRQRTIEVAIIDHPPTWDIKVSWQFP